MSNCKVLSTPMTLDCSPLTPFRGITRYGTFSQLTLSC